MTGARSPKPLNRQVARARGGRQRRGLAGAAAAGALANLLAERGLLAVGVAPRAADWTAVAVAGVLAGLVAVRALRRARSRPAAT